MALAYKSANQLGSIQEKLAVIKILLDYPFKITKAHKKQE
jgi:hypothetical protein